MGSQATDQRRGVDVVEGAKPAAANDAPETTPATLKQRMAAVRAEAFGIGKDNIKMKSRAGAEFTIKGHTVEAVLSEIRPLFEKHGLDIWPNLVERTYSGNRCDILVDFTFERTDDSEERRTIRWAGAGTDDGDKGFSKAGTNALKEMLKKVFLITDRDDAKEEEEKVEHKPEGAVAAVEAAKERAQDSIVGWAQTFKAAVENAADAATLRRLQADNAERLASPDLPPVTREFFKELLARRKAELSGK